MPKPHLAFACCALTVLCLMGCGTEEAAKKSEDGVAENSEEPTPQLNKDLERIQSDPNSQRPADFHGDSALQKMTAAELERTISSLRDGTRVRVTGVIESIPYVNRNLLSGEAVYSVNLYGFYSDPRNKSLSCKFTNAEVLQGLTEEQTIVVEGTVYQGRRKPDFAECKLISKGEIPEYAPAPFDTGKQPPLENLTPPEGIEISSEEGFLSVEKSVIAGDGTLPQEVLEKLAPRLEFGKVTVNGPISTAGLKQIAQLQGMKRLQLFDLKNMEQIDFSVLAEHPRLRSLSFKGIDQFTSEHLKQIGQFRCLTSIAVEGGFSGLDMSKVDDPGLVGLASLKSLRWLELQHEGNPTKVTDEGIAALSALPRLQVLDLWSESLDGSRFSALAACPELHTLQLSKCSVTPEGLKSLASLPNLAVLDLSETEADSSLATAIQELSHLRELDLSKSKISDDFFKNWGSHPSLTHLTLKNNALTDEAVKLLAENPSPHLTYLNLGNNQEITKASVERLKQIKSLETLIPPRSFDDSAKDELKQAIPGLKIF